MPLDVHATEEEDKLVVLSSLNRLGGCTEEQLLRFLVENALMNQFQFYLALGGLKEAGFIREARHLEGTLLILTPQGRESVEMFASRIRASQTEKLNANAPAWKRRIRDELQMPACVAGDGQRLRRHAARAGGRRGNLLHDADGGDEGAGEALLRALAKPRAVSVSDDHGAARRGGKRRKKFVKPARKQKKKTKSKKNGNVRRKRQKGRVKKRPTACARRTFFCAYEKMRKVALRGHGVEKAKNDRTADYHAESS